MQQWLGQYRHCFQQFEENLPKILQKEPYKIKIVYSTHEEQTNSEKIENLTIAEIKQKTLLLTEQFENKNMWLDLYKKEVAHVKFYSMFNEIIEDQEQKYSDTKKM